MHGSRLPCQTEKVAELKRHKARLEQRVEDLNASLKRRDRQAYKISTDNNSLVSQWKLVVRCLNLLCKWNTLNQLLISHPLPSITVVLCPPSLPCVYFFSVVHSFRNQRTSPSRSSLRFTSRSLLTIWAVLGQRSTKPMPRSTSSRAKILWALNEHAES